MSLVSSNFFISAFTSSPLPFFESLARIPRTSCRVISLISWFNNILEASSLPSSISGSCSDEQERKKPLLEYDFKKLSLIFFNEIQNRYLHEQSNIYLRNYPHHRTTEALTLRLSRGETSVYGAKILKPVDDLYAIIIDRLSTFIISPRSINFYSLNKDLDDSDKILEGLKEMITEKLSKLCVSKFTTPALKNMWKNLYMQNNMGADYRRRVGIIDIMNYILPSIDIYLSDTSKKNWIDKIEDIILTSIDELEEIMEIEKSRNMV